MPRAKLTPKEKEIAFCLNRIEQYWLLLLDRNAKRKLVGKKFKMVQDKLLEWEEILYDILDKHT